MNNKYFLVISMLYQKQKQKIDNKKLVYSYNMDLAKKIQKGTKREK